MLVAKRPGGKTAAWRGPGGSHIRCDALFRAPQIETAVTDRAIILYMSIYADNISNCGLDLDKMVDKLPDI